jgi:hypothetical protein
MARRHTHSPFSALSRDEKDASREAALTMARRDLRPQFLIQAKDAWGKQAGGGGAPNDPTIPTGRSGHQDESGAPAGTQNGRGLGTSPADGVELMARTIVNRTRAAGSRRRVRLPGA